MTETSAPDDLQTRFQLAFPPSATGASHRYRIGTVEFTVSSTSGSLLTQLTKALEHAVIPDVASEPSLRIEIMTCENVSADVFISELKARFNNQQVSAHTPDSDFFFSPGDKDTFDAISFYNDKTKRAVFVIKDEAQLSWYETAAPFRVIFNWFFKRYGYYLLHAACVGLGDKGILIIGKGGTGKSTTGLTALFTPDLSILCDDYCLVTMSPRPTAFCLYSSAKLTPVSLTLLPMLNHPSNVKHPKTILQLHVNHKEKLALSLTLVGLVLPKISSNNRTTIVPVSGAAALLALGPSTIYQLLHEDKHRPAFDVLTALVKQLPAKKIALTPDYKQVGATIKKVLSAFSES